MLLGLSLGVSAQRVIPKISYKQLEERLQKGNDTTFVVNFWATWCGPCVHELDTFEQLNVDSQNRKMKILLVSMDFVQELEGVLQPFVKRKGLQASVMLLNEPDYNSWINQVSDTWNGTIPATLIVNTSKKRRVFFEKSLTYDFILKELQKNWDVFD
jgi:thiol-disulfide isomerase/thioredoxin